MLIGLFLFVFLIVPVVKVVYVAFQDPNTGALTLINFVDFFNILYRFTSFYSFSLFYIIVSSQ